MTGQNTPPKDSEWLLRPSEPTVPGTQMKTAPYRYIGTLKPGANFIIFTQ